jgi:twitching motility protein PilU
LYALYRSGEITYEDALAHADSANDLRLMIKLGDESSSDQLDNIAGSLTLEENQSDDFGGGGFKR